METETTKYVAGTFWATYEGHKAVVVAFDFITDNLIVYDCATKQERVVTREAIEDSLMSTSWSETQVFERGLLEGVREGFSKEIRDVFMVGKDNQESLPAPYFANDPGEKEFYDEYVLTRDFDKISVVTTRVVIDDVVKVIREDLEKNKVDKIIWRVAPEFDVYFEVISGVRVFKLYARFAAYSENKRVAANVFAGYRDPERLTISLD